MKRSEHPLLTESEFEAVAHLAINLAGFKAERLQAARMVMVDGNTFRSAAEKHGTSHQGVSKTVTRLREMLLDYRKAKGIESQSGN